MVNSTRPSKLTRLENVEHMWTGMYRVFQKYGNSLISLEYWIAGKQNLSYTYGSNEEIFLYTTQFFLPKTGAPREIKSTFSNTYILLLFVHDSV